MANSIHERNAISKENGIYINTDFVNKYMVDLVMGEVYVLALYQYHNIFTLISDFLVVHGQLIERENCLYGVSYLNPYIQRIILQLLSFRDCTWK